MRTTAPRRLGGVLATLVAVAGAWALIWLSLRIAPHHGLDYRVYWQGGQSVLAGANGLYNTPVEYPGGSLLFTYPPFAALVFAVLGPLGPEVGAWFFVALSIVIAAFTSAIAVQYIFRLPNLLAVLKHPWLRALAVLGSGAVILLGPWRETNAFSQINILLFALIMVDLLLARSSWPAGFLTGITAGIKLTPLVFGLYFVIRRDWAGLRNMAVGFLATFGLGYIFLPTESRQYWTELLPDTSRIGGGGYVDNLSLKGAILHFAGPEFNSTPLWLAGSLLLTVAAAVVIALAERRGAHLLAVSATALLMLLISPVSWSHHWVWIAVFLPVLVVSVRTLAPEHALLRTAGYVLLVVSTVVFYLSPKTIGVLLGSDDLNSQLPEPWLMASSAGLFCGVAMLLYWLAVLWVQRDRVREHPGLPAAVLD